METPEERATFDGRLRAVANQIADPSLKAHYLAEFRERRKKLWKKPFMERILPGRGQKATAPRPVSQKMKPGYEKDVRVALILRTILQYPEFGKRFTDELTEMSCPNPKIDRLRKEVVMAYGDEVSISRLANDENLRLLEFGQIIANLSYIKNSDDAARALDVVSDDLNREQAQKQAQMEIDRVMRELQDKELTEETEAVIKSAVIMRDETRKVIDDRLDEDEDKRAFLHQFLESERWRK